MFVLGAHILASLMLGLAAAPPAAAEQRHGYWYEPGFETHGEESLRDALVMTAFGGPDARIAALERVWSAHPGTLVAGLARIAAGLSLIESRRVARAATLLGHPDVRLTALSDHALLALARAYRDAGDKPDAGKLFLAAAKAQTGSPLICPALIEGASVLADIGRLSEAADASMQALAACPERTARVLLILARVRNDQKNSQEAASCLDRLDREHPAAPERVQAADLMRSLARYLPPLTPIEQRRRNLQRALALFDAKLYREAESLLGALQKPRSGTVEDDLIAVRLGRTLLALGRRRAGLAQLASVPTGSPYEAEALYHRARRAPTKDNRLAGYEAVARCCPGSPWAGAALIRLASNHLAQGRADDAVPFFRQLLAADTESRDARRASWHVAWADFRHGRYDAAAQSFERAARVWPSERETAGFLYWAGRARIATGQTDRARDLFAETVRRFKHAYHGMKAREALGELPAPPTKSPAPPAFVRPMAEDAAADIPEPSRARVRQLVLINRHAEAIGELKSLPLTPGVQATIGWLERRSERLRPAIVSMKRAYPEWIGEAGDLLPEPVWRILYPLEFEEMIVSKAVRENIDPALIAALICQESTFQAAALSPAGARGLMQIMPATGRQIARELGTPFSRQALHDPAVSLDFGLHYLREMIDSFGGRIERALAAYNAGPHRVTQWTSSQPDMPAEMFIENIPFSETRHYVATVLANQAHYRRIYALGTPGHVHSARNTQP
ncbi:MAG: transglycosylase SLT domain-containing protein [Vicinamibacteria bacterium]|nr:transglycosylase SLT domain-containing protein [Vicinamibacteria bacterium]